jgi:hypothetical protein
LYLGKDFGKCQCSIIATVFILNSLNTNTNSTE